LRLTITSIYLFCYIVKVCPPDPYPVAINEEVDLSEVVLLLVDLVEVTVVQLVWARKLAFLALQHMFIRLELNDQILVQLAEVLPFMSMLLLRASRRKLFAITMLLSRHRHYRLGSTWNL